MTICEKFKLMMASFADIRAAIAEKGGTVTGGYADFLVMRRKADITVKSYQKLGELPIKGIILLFFVI